MADEKKSLSRREFLQQLMTGAVGAAFVLRDLKAPVFPSVDTITTTVDPRSIAKAKQIPTEELTGTLLVAQQQGDFMLAQCSNGKYLRWTIKGNPVWIQGGEAGEYSVIRWGLPEIASYANDPGELIHYTQLMEMDAGYSLVEQKEDISYVQAIHTNLIQQLWGQQDRGTRIRDGLLFEAINPTKTAFFLTTANLQNGFSLEGWFKVNGNATILELKNGSSSFALSFSAADNIFSFRLANSNQSIQSQSERGNYADGGWHHVNVIVDTNPQLIHWIIDGKLEKGTRQRTGWTTPMLTTGNTLYLTQSADVQIGTVRIYGRALRNTELLSSYHSYGQGMGRYDYES